ncbi:MAG: acyltransferase [Bacteroidaceae bacterium]|nr:acyltransferase [Bacteroidaceae bacterium]
MSELIVTVITYLLCLVLLLWGGNFAGFKDEFHEDFMSLQNAKALRGFAAIGVILHHISQEDAFQTIKQIGIFKDAGYFMVAIFFLCSGYGLMKNLETKPDYLDGFLKKRLPVIVIPFYGSAVLYTVYRLFVAKEELAVAQIITGLLGFTMINEYAWYPIILTIMYITFYLAFKNGRNRKVSMGIILFVTLALGMIFCVNGHFAWWAAEGDWWFNPGFDRAWWMEEKTLLLSGEWWVNSVIAFFVGMVLCVNEERIVPWLKKHYWIKLVTVFVLARITLRISRLAQATVGYWSEWSGNGPHITDKMICYACQLPEVIFFVLLIYMILMKYHAENPVSRFFSKASLYTYLMNLMAIKICRPILYTAFGSVKKSAYNLNQGLFMIAVFALTIVLGLLLQFICEKLIKVRA